jgi:leucyl aminopeptidase
MQIMDYEEYILIKPITKQIFTRENIHCKKKYLWSTMNKFEANPNQVCFFPSRKGKIKEIWFGISDVISPWNMASMFINIPASNYILDTSILSISNQEILMTGWSISSYSYHWNEQVKNSSNKFLSWPKEINKKRIISIKESMFLGRDLINIPAHNLNSTNLANFAKLFFSKLNAKCTIINDNNLKKNYPAIHAIGKAGETPPCLIDVTWGKNFHTKVTLVGKGVCFDSGGLNVKNEKSMLIMKKDMGGAAYCIALAKFIIELGLLYKLRVLIPSVENSISHKAIRPKDIINTKKGLSVEINNTDAEGRVILADALFEGSKDNPDILIDCATLTGAARIAMGTEVPVFFTNNKMMGRMLMEESEKEQDLLWELPIVKSYNKQIIGNISDLKNVGKVPYGGAIVAAIFLEKFIDKNNTWIHIDTMAWNLYSSPGRPEGGDLMGLRSIIRFIESFKSY